MRTYIGLRLVGFLCCVMAANIHLVEGRGPFLRNERNRTCCNMASMQKGDAEVRVCFEISKTQAARNLTVEYSTPSPDWELEIAHLWVGQNATNIPVIMEQGKSKPKYSSFPYEKNRIGSKSSSFIVSLINNLDFVCRKQVAESVLAVAHAVVRNKKTSQALHFSTKDKDRLSSLEHAVITLSLSCPSEEPKLEKMPHIENLNTHASPS